MQRSGCILAVTILLASGVVTQAAPLNLLLEDYPDITSLFKDVSYNAGTNAFAVTGFAATIRVDPGPALDFDAFGTFDISALIDNSGAPLGGTLSITGDLTSTLGVSGTLLTGNLTEFGWFGTTRDVFEFLFEVSGGALATPAYYGPAGSIVGVIYDSGEDVFSGSFAGSFSSSGFGFGVSDSAPIPEPTTLTMLLLPGLLLLRRRPRFR